VEIMAGKDKRYGGGKDMAGKDMAGKDTERHGGKKKDIAGRKIRRKYMAGRKIWREKIRRRKIWRESGEELGFRISDLYLHRPSTS